MRNLAYNCTQEDLEELFGKFGKCDSGGQQQVVVRHRDLCIVGPLYCGTSILLEGFQTVCLVNPGPIAEVHLSIDTVTKKIRGYAFILFMMPEHAVRAYEELDGTIFMVR